MNDYKRLNILIGWGVFLIAAITYLLTLEPTVSFWDCGEFIAASYKLEVGHPPGAPLFLIVARVFTLFAGGNAERVAVMVNAFSGLVSAFTILFLFWTITHLVKRFVGKDDEPGMGDKIIIFGSGIVGALAYTFSDTFWFSAVEGEVYATSSLFTAIVFWAILKWENESSEKYANRWLILIAYLMGLSIGVHLLNLLAIPAIVLIYYFKKYNTSPKGLILALVISAGILGTIMYVIIPGLVKLAIQFELLFVNGFGLPYFTGVFFYLILLAAAVGGGIYYTQKKHKVLANTILLAVGVIIIGYSSYAMVVIRSLANPPMDQNNPEHMFNLLSYLNRDQYGDRPLIYGQAFNAPYLKDSENRPEFENDRPVYVQEDGKYRRVAFTQKPVYDSDFNMLFPRMYSPAQDHVEAYKHCADLGDSDLYQPVYQNGQVLRGANGKEILEPRKKPSLKDNLVFLFRYQLGHMYYRYFMWNFAGRQNDIQARYRHEITTGNWLTGIRVVDEKRLGNQSQLTSEMLQNKGRNTYFLLPLLLGLIGMIFHYRKDQKNFWVVLSLFFLTGIAIVLYLNQTPLQPRERDYAYAGSFYAFAIWIGIAVAGLYQAARELTWDRLLKIALWGGGAVLLIGVYDYAATSRLSYVWTYFVLLILLLMALALTKYIGSVVSNNRSLSSGILAICLAVPVLMAVQNWDDHDRSDRYTARDIAYNYLNSCGENAILYTMGDNETFPVWYLQEVEEKRTDVRTINLSYLNTDWYINQMRLKAYDSKPVKMTLQPEQLYFGRRDNTYLLAGIPDISVERMRLEDAISLIADDSIQPRLFSQLNTDDSLYYINTNSFTMPGMQWQIKDYGLTKAQLMGLDFLASNHGERPICWAGTMGDIRNEQVFLGLADYLESTGLAYTLNPGKTSSVNREVSYDNLMNKFKWGGIDKNKDIYLNEDCLRMYRAMRYKFIGLISEYLYEEGNGDNSKNTEKARNLLDKSLSLFPLSLMPYDMLAIEYIRAYAKLGDSEKVFGLTKEVTEILDERVSYIQSLKSPFNEYLDEYYVQVTLDSYWELFRLIKQEGYTQFERDIRSKLVDFTRSSYQQENFELARAILLRIGKEQERWIGFYSSYKDSNSFKNIQFFQDMKEQFMSISREYKDAEFLQQNRIRQIGSDLRMARIFDQLGKDSLAIERRRNITDAIEKDFSEPGSGSAQQIILEVYKNLATQITSFREYPTVQTLEQINAEKVLADAYTLYDLARRSKPIDNNVFEGLVIYEWELIKFNYLSGDQTGGQKHEQSFMNFIQDCYQDRNGEIIQYAVNVVYQDFMQNMQNFERTSSRQAGGEMYYGYMMLSKFASFFRLIGDTAFSENIEKELRKYEPVIKRISNQ